MGHFHDHKVQLTHRGRLCWSIAIVATVLVIEIVGGWLSGSLALVADAGHMVSDLIGLIIALVASIIAAPPATDQRGYLACCRGVGHRGCPRKTHDKPAGRGAERSYACGCRGRSHG